MTRSDIIQTYRENPEQAHEAQEQLQNLWARSATDMDFRHTLLNDPRAAMKEFTGRELPADLTIKFVESEGKPTLVLPPFVGADAELNEADLEAVSGGATPGIVLVCWVAGMTVAILSTADC
jgi:hypothetical protein